MADLDESSAAVNARIVYWGIEGAGKRTNLRVIHSKLRPDHRGALKRVPTRLDPSVSYWMMPIELGDIGGVRTRIQVATVPSGDEHAPTRKQLLDQVDGVVFVVDTTRERLDANLASFEELRSALAAYGRDLATVPLVIQYNKRDLGDPYALEELHRKLSMRGAAAFEAVATEGTAVLATLTTISKRVIRHLRERGPEAEAAQAPPEPEPIAEPAPPDATLVDGAGLDPSLLGDHPAASDLAQRAQAAFEPDFRRATAEPAEATGGPLEIRAVGTARQSGPRGVRVPVMLEDGSGRRLRVALHVEIEIEEPEAG